MSEMSTGDLNRSVRQAFMDGGFAAPPSSPDPGMGFKIQLDAMIQRNNGDRHGKRIEVDRYLKEFILPMIADCPVDMRKDAPRWTKEFDISLGVCRRNGCYMNPWPKKKAGGMSAHSNFDHIKPGTADENF